MKTVIADIKAFLTEHRSIIYFVVILLLVDHFLLGGKLTARIKASAEKLLGVVEHKIDKAAEAEIATPAAK